MPPNTPNIQVDADRGSVPEDVVRHGPRRWAAIDKDLPPPPPPAPYHPYIPPHKGWLRGRYNVGPTEEERDLEARYLMGQAVVDTPYMLGVYTSGPYVSPLIPTPGDEMLEGAKQVVGGAAKPIQTVGQRINYDDLESLARAAGYIK